MKHVPWIFLLVSVLLFFAGAYSKLAGRESWLLGYTASTWWRVSMSFAVWAIAAKIVCPFSKSDE